MTVNVGFITPSATYIKGRTLIVAVNAQADALSGKSANARLGVIGGNMRETTFKILTQGDVQMAHCQGYMVAGGEDAVCFYLDPRGRAYISASTESDSGCPVVYVSRDDCERDTEIEFSEFKGWRFHAGGDGKAIAVALVRRAADDA